MSLPDLFARLQENERRAKKAKEKSMGESSKFLDLYTKYALNCEKPMPIEFIIGKAGAKAVLAWMMTPPIDILGIFESESLIEEYEILQSGHSAVPDAIVDEAVSSWELLVTGGNEGLGGYGDDGSSG